MGKIFEQILYTEDRKTASKLMNRCPTSVAIWTTCTAHLDEGAKMKIMPIPSAYRNAEGPMHSRHFYSRNCQTSIFQKMENCHFPKLNTHSVRHLEIPVLSICPGHTKTDVHVHLYMGVYCRSPQLPQTEDNIDICQQASGHFFFKAVLHPHCGISPSNKKEPLPPGRKATRRQSSRTALQTNRPKSGAHISIKTSGTASRTGHVRPWNKS